MALVAGSQRSLLTAVSLPQVEASAKAGTPEGRKPLWPPGCRGGDTRIPGKQGWGRQRTGAGRAEKGRQRVRTPPAGNFPGPGACSAEKCKNWQVLPSSARPFHPNLGQAALHPDAANLGVLGHHGLLQREGAPLVSIAISGPTFHPQQSTPDLEHQPLPGKSPHQMPSVR